MSIDAHRSAVIPVFQTSLDDSNAVFYFKEANHAERPYRAIKFKNTTGHSLGRGICTIYDQTTFAGTCVLPATKPDEESFLAHALETGIRVQKEPSHEQNRRVGIKIADGVAYNSHHVAITTNYVINSSRDESLPFVLDHPWRIAPDAEFECLLHRQNHDEPIQISFDKLKNGIRTEFQLLERDVVVITVLEAKVTRSQIKLAGEHGGDERFRVPWLYENIVESDLALADDPNVRDCIEIHKLLLEKNDQILHANAEITKHEKRQERLRKNIQTGGGEQQNLRWQNDLARAEDAIVQLEEEHIPALEREQEQLRSRLETALRSLIIEWNE